MDIVKDTKDEEEIKNDFGFLEIIVLFKNRYVLYSCESTI